MWIKQLARWGSAVGLAAALMAAGVAGAAPAVGDVVDIPALTLLDGQQRPAGFYRDKPVILEYWASWCPFCSRQNVYMQALWEEAQNAGLEVLTISIDRKEADARQYLQDKSYTFPSAMHTPELQDIFGKPRVIPLVVVIQPDGTVAEVIPGEMFEEDVRELINYAP